MAVNLGSSNITTIKLGATDVSKIYLGSDVVFGDVAPFDFGNALKFDGVNDYVTIPTISGYSNLTLNFWIKIQTGSGYGYIFSDSNGRGIAVREDASGAGFSAGELYFYTGVLVHTTCIIPFNEWTMISIVFDGATWKIYKNAILQYTVTATAFFNINRIGRWNTTTANHFAGTLDELVIYLSDLSPLDIENIYNSGNYTNPTSIVASPLSYYEFNESGAETTLTDSSGNGNDGTLNNFTTPPDYWVAH